jgi:hypothetical protein
MLTLIVNGKNGLQIEEDFLKLGKFKTQGRCVDKNGQSKWIWGMSQIDGELSGCKEGNRSRKVHRI